MGQSLAAAAVSGMSEYTLSPEQRAMLTQGDIDSLLELHRSQFGSAVMEDDDDEDDDESEDDDQNDDGDDSDDADDEDDDQDEDGEGGAKGKKTDPKDRKIQELAAESKKYRLKNREHRNRIAELERQVAEAAKGKKKVTKKDDAEDEDDSPEADPEVTRRLEEATRQNEDLLIRLEFMANKKHSWKNPKAALKLLDLSDVEITDDGEIEGLDEAIEELAKSEPYLLEKGKEDADETKRRRRGATGQPTGGTKRKAGNPNRDKLISKYPALRR